MKEYQIVESVSPKSLENSVRIEMLSGWEPIGGACVSHGNFVNPIWAQAMIREKDTSES
jgi:hypothetical protein